jgi:hypothetical protein
MKTIISVLVFGSTLWGQMVINGGRTILGPWDASAATWVKPLPTGLLSALPGTCAVGEMYFATDAVAGRKVRECSATNTWSVVAYDQGTSAPGTCAPGQIFFDTDATAGQNLHLCTSPDTWTQVEGATVGGKLYSAFNQATLASTGADADFPGSTYTVAAGTMGTNDCLKVTLITTRNSGSNTRTEKVWFGGASVTTQSGVAGTLTSSTSWFCNAASASSNYTMVPVTWTGSTFAVVVPVATSVDTAADVTVKVTDNAASGNVSQLRSIVVELVRGI